MLKKILYYATGGFSIYLVLSYLGAISGLTFYTAYYAKGGSYLSNDPKACVNCHIMQDNYQGWTKSSHHHVASCNDCHAPKDFIGKYSSKAYNGFMHSYKFTTGDFSDPIQIKPFNKRITENACVSCHQNIFESAPTPDHSGKNISCLKCHSHVGHNK